MKTAMPEQCYYDCGPYKDYCGRAEYDPDADIFHGEVLGTQDVVTFQGRLPAELRKAFQDSVDDYLRFCEEVGKAPDKPFSGKFVTRLNPALHKKLSVLARSRGQSLNQFVCECLDSVARSSSLPEGDCTIERPIGSPARAGKSRGRQAQAAKQDRLPMNEAKPRRKREIA